MTMMDQIAHLTPIKMRSQPDPMIDPSKIPKRDRKINTSLKFQAEKNKDDFHNFDNQDSFELLRQQLLPETVDCKLQNP